MAVLTIANVVPRLIDGNADLTGLYSLRQVAAGDTVDLSTLGTSPSFQNVLRAVTIGFPDFVEIAANASGSVVTIPAGFNHNTCPTGYLLVWGC